VTGAGLAEGPDKIAIIYVDGRFERTKVQAMLRLVAALLLGLVVGVVSAFFCNAVIYGSPEHGYGSMQSIYGPWGFALGTAAGFAALISVFVWKPSLRTRKIALWVAAAVLGFAGVATSLWIIMWGFSPFTLEGASLYPLAGLSLVASVFASVRARRTGSRAGWP
jgi:uncharacterized BrkB/YihY/UPF0761 family membrane protein